MVKRQTLEVSLALSYFYFLFFLLMPENTKHKEYEFTQTDFYFTERAVIPENELVRETKRAWHGELWDLSIRPWKQSFFNVSSMNKTSCQTESACQDHLLLTLILKNVLASKKAVFALWNNEKEGLNLTASSENKKALKMSKRFDKNAFPNTSKGKCEGVREGFSCKQSAHLITRWLICQLFCLFEKSWQPSLSFSFSPTPS